MLMHSVYKQTRKSNCFQEHRREAEMQKLCVSKHRCVVDVCLCKYVHGVLHFSFSPLFLKPTHTPPGSAVAQTRYHQQSPFGPGAALGWSWGPAEHGPSSTAGTDPPPAQHRAVSCSCSRCPGSGECGMRLCRARASVATSLGSATEISAPKTGPSDAKTPEHATISRLQHSGELTTPTELGRES